MKITIHETNLKLDKKSRGYINQKLSSLDKYLSKHSLESVHLETFVKSINSKLKNQYEIEVLTYLPHELLKVKTRADQLEEVVDCTKDKLKVALTKYKAIHESRKTKLKLNSKLASLV